MRPRSNKPRYHHERLDFCTQFEGLWSDQLGNYFELPDKSTCFGWFRVCGWDWQLLTETVADLLSRCDRPFASWEHGIKQFSATLVKLTKERYGRTSPLCKDLKKY